MSKDRLTAICLFGFSLLYLLGCWQLKLGSARAPGPGFLPTIIGVGLLACTGTHLLQTLRVPRPAAGPSGAGSHRQWTVLALLGCTFIYPVFLNRLNFIPTTFATVLAMLLLLRYRTWMACVLLAAGLTVACFLIFAVLLGVAVPSGFLEELLYRVRG